MLERQQCRILNRIFRNFAFDLDGHVVLSRVLADEGHYPAIDVEASISRVMQNIVSPDHLKHAQRFKQIYARYQQSKDLINVGAYTPGSDPETDFAIEKLPGFRQFLQQGLNDSVTINEATEALKFVIAPSAPAANIRNPVPRSRMIGS